MNRNCDYCSKQYDADPRALKRGWGLCCSKSCAASMREKKKPGYDPKKVAANNIRRANWNSLESLSNMTTSQKINWNQRRWGMDAPNICGGSGIIQGITSEGYRIMDGVAYDEWDDAVYNYDSYEEDDPSWDSHK